MTAPLPGPRSVTRTITGLVALVGSVVVIAAGFVLMVTALQAGGYGTSAVTLALVVLALGGGLLALGIALLIWEMSVRYGIRR